MSKKPNSLQSQALNSAGVLAIALLATAGPAAAEEPIGTAFTYQGNLQEDGLPVDDMCAFEFSLWNAPMGGDDVGPTLTPTVTVSEGGFTVPLDFGENIFIGDARWLKVAVCCPAPCKNYTTLPPRQELTPAPYALHTPSAASVPWSGLTDVPAGFADGIDDDALGGLSCADEQLAKWDGAQWQCGEDIDTDTDTLAELSCANGELAKWNNGAAQWECAADESGGGGASTLDEAYDGGGAGAGRTITADAGAVNIQGPDGLTVAGIITSGSSITIDGIANTVTSSADLELRVSSGRAVLIEGNATSPNLIGGYGGNSLEPGAVGATIGGGGAAADENRVFDDYATVSGGKNNQAGRDDGGPTNRRYATVGGGEGNTASGEWSTVAGGESNTASGENSTVGGGQSNIAGAGGASTVGGGFENVASGSGSTIAGGDRNISSTLGTTVGGGRSNTASGVASTVPGGERNTAAGTHSFAAGNQAKANHFGTFVWADRTGTDFASTAVNQFNVRASGGTRIFSNSTATVGVQLAAGGNSWSAISDRNLKENFTLLDPAEVLEKLARVPVTQWNLKSQDPSIQHIGPMAQDFHAAFGLGESDRYISSSDADGVALAAIQGLHEIVLEKDCEIAALRAEMDDRIAALEKKLSELGAKVGE